MAGHAPRIDPQPEAGIHPLAQPEQPLAAGRRPVEVVDLEGEEVAIADEHVAIGPGIFGARHESAEIQVHRLLRVAGGGDHQS